MLITNFHSVSLFLCLCLHFYFYFVFGTSTVSDPNSAAQIGDENQLFDGSDECSSNFDSILTTNNTLAFALVEAGSRNTANHQQKQRTNSAGDQSFFQSRLTRSVEQHENHKPKVKKAHSAEANSPNRLHGHDKGFHFVLLKVTV